jgi:hypothetical protein
LDLGSWKWSLFFFFLKQEEVYITHYNKQHTVPRGVEPFVYKIHAEIPMNISGCQGQRMNRWWIEKNIQLHAPPLNQLVNCITLVGRWMVIERIYFFVGHLFHSCKNHRCWNIPFTKTSSCFDTHYCHILYLPLFCGEWRNTFPANADKLHW